MSLKCSIQIIACIVYRQDFNQILERYIQVRNAACVGILDNFLISVLVRGKQIYHVSVLEGWLVIQW